MSDTESAEYAHLFGDVYWKQHSAMVIPLAVIVVTAFVPFETLVDLTPGLFRWLFETAPNVYLWLGDNYGIIPWTLSAFVVAFSIRLNPDVDDGTESP